jgi:hypothetical protein
MNAPHLHLLLNHIPVLGTLFGAGLLGFAQWRKNEALRKAALVVFVLGAILTVPVYLTGEPAEDAIMSLPGISETLIDAHEGAAKFAFVGILLLGVASLGTLAGSSRAKLLPSWWSNALLVASLVVAGLMAWTANLGGQVHHPEIRPDFPTDTPASQKHD